MIAKSRLGETSGKAGASVVRFRRSCWQACFGIMFLFSVQNSIDIYPSRLIKADHILPQGQNQRKIVPPNLPLRPPPPEPEQSGSGGIRANWNGFSGQLERIRQGLFKPSTTNDNNNHHADEGNNSGNDVNNQHNVVKVLPSEGGLGAGDEEDLFAEDLEAAYYGLDQKLSQTVLEPGSSSLIGVAETIQPEVQAEVQALDVRDATTSHIPRLGGGYLCASLGGREIGGLDYSIRGGKMLLVSRVEVYGDHIPHLTVSRLLFAKLVDMFPSYIIETFLEITPRQNLKAQYMWDILTELATEKGLSCSRPVAEDQGSATTDSIHSKVKEWDLAVLTPPTRQGEWHLPRVCMPDKGCEIRIRQAGSPGGGTLFADLYDRGHRCSDAGKLIYHERPESNAIRVAFLHVKAQCRRKGVASALLDHLHKCLFPNRILHIIFQSSSSEIRSAWKTLKSFGSRHSFSIYRYPYQEESQDLLEDTEYLPNAFEMLEFHPKKQAAGRLWCPYTPLISRSKSLSNAVYNEVFRVVKGKSSSSSEAQLDPGAHTQRPAAAEKRWLPYPQVARLEPPQVRRMRKLIHALTGRLASVTVVKQKNPGIGSVCCDGTHPYAGPMREKHVEEGSPAAVEMDVSGLLRMLAERTMFSVGHK